MKFHPKQLLVYAIAGGEGNGLPLCKQVEQAIRGGATLIQLREKTLSRAELIRTAREVKKVCNDCGVPFLLNDDAKTAIELGCDGVHVGAEDMPVEDVRKIAPKDFIIGATAKSVPAARYAEQAGADYIGVGAIFSSPTKPCALRVSKEELFTICRAVRIPAVAIGGLTRSNLETLKGGGMSGFAFVSAIFSSPDIVSETQKLRQAAESVLFGTI